MRSKSAGGASTVAAQLCGVEPSEGRAHLPLVRTTAVAWSSSILMAVMMT